MKTIKLVFIAIVAMFTFNGCGELLTADIDVPIIFNLIEHVVVPGDLDPEAKNQFVSGGEYDILSHEEIANVIGTPDKIKKVKITKVLYEFYNFSGNVDAVVSGDFILPNSDFGSGGLYGDEDKGLSKFSIKPVKVAEKVVTGEEFNLNGNYDGVNDYLSKGTILHHAFLGTSTHNPAKFDIVVTITATVTVEASLDMVGNYK